MASGIVGEQLAAAAPSSVAGPPPQAALRARLNAIVLDIILLGAVEALLRPSLGIARGAGDQLALLWGLQTLYFVVLEGMTGQTVGKRVFHVRVATVDGLPASGRQVLVRNLLRIFDGLPAFYVSGLISLMRTGPLRRQRIGDVAAGTTVVLADDGKPLRTPGWLLPAVALFAAALSALVIYSAAHKPTAQRPTASGFAAGPGEAPAEGVWQADGTTTHTAGYGNDHVGRELARRWTILHSCAAGSCGYTLIYLLRTGSPMQMSLVPEPDGWHARYANSDFVCGFTPSGEAIHWVERAELVLHFRAGGSSAEGNESRYSEDPRCGSANSQLAWTARHL